VPVNSMATFCYVVAENLEAEQAVVNDRYCPIADLTPYSWALLNQQRCQRGLWSSHCHDGTLPTGLT
jgi:hypothetical protein